MSYHTMTVLLVLISDLPNLLLSFKTISEIRNNSHFMFNDASNYLRTLNAVTSNTYPVKFQHMVIEKP